MSVSSLVLVAAAEDLPQTHRCKYNLEHLQASEAQRQMGPMQDDEMLLLFAWVRTTRAARVLEIGGLGGRSAYNFLTATDGLPGAVVYTVDLRHLPSRARNHVVLTKDAAELTSSDVNDRPLDLLLLDCHNRTATLRMLRTLEAQGLLHERTTLALHDTGLHQIREGAWLPPGLPHYNKLKAHPNLHMHQQAERLVVEELRKHGIDGTGRYKWAAVHAHADEIAPNDPLAFRHGLTLMQRSQPLHTELQQPYVGEGAGT